MSSIYPFTCSAWKNVRLLKNFLFGLGHILSDMNSLFSAYYISRTFYDLIFSISWGHDDFLAMQRTLLGLALHIHSIISLTYLIIISSSILFFVFALPFFVLFSFLLKFSVSVCCSCVLMAFELVCFLSVDVASCLQLVYKQINVSKLCCGISI